MALVFDAIYVLLLIVASPYLLYQSLVHHKYRQGWRQKFLGHSPRRQGNRPCLWLHAVSVGEVNLIGVFLKRFEMQHPDWECVISTTTRTGYELACRRFAPRPVFYCPLDFSWAVRTALRRVRPTVLILAELELWPNLILAAKKSAVRVAIINGRLSDRSFRGYRRIRPLMRWLLQQIDVIGVQDDQYARRFVALGAHSDCTAVTGSLKFDGAETDRNNSLSRSLAELWPLPASDLVFLAGSTQAPEEEVVLDVFRSLAEKHSNLRLIVTPRHAERFQEVAAMLQASGLDWQRRSQLVPGQAPAARILLVDTIGELGGWWGRADIAFVGGSLGNRGGQNMVEPAAYGAAVCFGPNTRNFRDIVRLLLEGNAAVVVRDREQLGSFVERCLQQPHYRHLLGEKARQLVLEQKGAVELTLRLVENGCQIGSRLRLAG